MFSGFNPNSRNSSKVLRPLGGGSSDIFGLKEQQEEERVEAVQEDNLNVDESSASEDKITNTSNAEKVEEVDDIQPPVESDIQTETALPESSNSMTSPSPSEDSSPAPTSSSGDPSPAPPVAGVRGRIPPGGHSSGSFW